LPLVVLGAAATVLDVRARERESTVSALAHAAVFAFSGGLLLTCVTVAFAMRCGTFTRTRAIAGGRGRVPCETLAVLGASPPQPALQTTAHAVMLAVWTAGFWYLGTVNGPFVAPRALLPCVLSLVLALVTLFPRAAELGRAMPWATVAVTAVCGLLVGAADSQWAGIYRTWAPHLAEKHRPAAGTLYFLGHWGWQHYAQAAGMQQFDAARTRLQPGDLVVLPANVDCPLPIDRVLRGCQVVASDVVPSSPWLPRTRNPQGLIFLHGDTRHGRIPWGWSAPDAPEEVFVVFRYGG
jgi:hypothetical protein